MRLRKWIWALAGLACMLALTVLAAIFYRERGTFCDMAYAVVLNIISRKPSWYYVRVGAVGPQFFTLAAVYLGAPLRAVMVVHSISYLLLYLIVYFIALRYSRTRLLYLAIPLHLLLLATDSFFWPISEVQQGLVLLCLYAVVLYEGLWGHPQGGRWYLHLLALIWIQFLHPLLLFPIVFLILYFYAGRRALLSLQALSHLLMAIVAFGLRYLVSSHDPYESGKMDVAGALAAHLPHLWQLDTVHLFIGRLASSYLCYLILLVTGIIWLVYHRRYLSAALVLVASAGYWVLIMVVATADQRAYMENMLLFLGFIVTLVMVADVLPSIPFRMAVAVFVLIAAIRLGGIYTAADRYTERLHIYDPYLRYAEQKDLIGVWVPDSLIDEKKAMVPWAACYETMLLTALDDSGACRIVHVDHDFSGISWGLTADTTLITKYWSWDRSQLPQRYFRMVGRHYEIVTERR